MTDNVVALLALAAFGGGAIVFYRHLRLLDQLKVQPNSAELASRGPQWPAGDRSLDRYPKRIPIRQAAPAEVDRPSFSERPSSEAGEPAAKADGTTSVLDQALGFLSFGLTVDPDRDNRRQAYDHVAAFLRERLDCSQASAREIVHCLCDEPDETLLAEGEPCDSDLLAKATDLLLAVQVEYCFEDSRQAQRVTTIAFLEGGQPKKRTVREAIDWDLLPKDVRDERLRQAATRVAFQLYPRSDATTT